MSEFWNSLDTPMMIVWCITLAASVVFVIQSVMTFLGADADSGADTDFDGSADAGAGSDFDAGGDIDSVDGPGYGDGDMGMNLLTFKNFVNFCLGFGWSAILLKDDIASIPLLLFLSALVGVALVVAVMYLYKWLWSMQQSGNIYLCRSAKGCRGTVYIPIAAQRGGEGKVQISINGSIREYDALTDGPALKTGARITVVDVVNSSTVLVEEEGAEII